MSVSVLSIPKEVWYVLLHGNALTGQTEYEGAAHEAGVCKRTGRVGNELSELRGGMASEVVDEIRVLVCGLIVIEGQHCHCDHVKEPMRMNRQREETSPLARQLTGTMISERGTL